MPASLRALTQALSLACLAGAGWLTATPALAWEPTRTVEFIVPAGTGGGADQMARMIQGVIQKNKLMDQSLVVINKAGGAGAEGFLDVKGSAGNPNKIVITLSNVFTTPLATGVPFNYQDITPVGMLAMDEFVLWVSAKSPYQTAGDYVAALKSTAAGQMKMGGTGSKQEDQIITAAIEQTTGAKLTYVPFKGGGDVAAQLVGEHIDSSVNNPIEAVSQWRAGELRPLCVFDSERMPFKEPIADGKSWADIPTCTEAGLPIEYKMMRGIFTTPGASREQVAYYQGVLEEVRGTPEWQEFVARGAFEDRFLRGDEFKAWLVTAYDQHKTLMAQAGFLAK
ncbi:MAG: Bug family tripartite tricarboxylate transporter substrate binding protein [Geminicoccaceae bacterium]